MSKSKEGIRGLTEEEVLGNRHAAKQKNGLIRKTERDYQPALRAHLREWDTFSPI